MLQSLAQKLWGRFESRDECIKYIRLALIFAFTIGIYWLINPLKDVVFLRLVGKGFLPYAKVVSVLVLFPLLIIYGRLVDLFPRHRIFYVLCTVYGVGSLVFAYLLNHPAIGLPNTTPDSWRLVAWLWYAFVESFGSLMVVLFWSFASDTSTPEGAKRGFSIVALGAQIGGVVGPLLIYPLTGILGPVFIIIIASIGMSAIGGMIFYFMRVTPAKELVGFHTDKPTAERAKSAPGFFEGLRLIASQPYLMGIVTVVALYEITFTIIEFHMKIFAAEVFTNVFDMTSFFFKYAVLVNGAALLSLVLGAGAIGRWLGLQLTLLLLPLLVSVGVGFIWLFPTLAVALGVLVVCRGLNYALNQPAKEQLYIPTSRDSKYKAKAWIDSFGSRFSKTVGSSVHMLRPVLQSLFMTVSSMICFGLIGLWIMVAIFVAKKHAAALKENIQIC